ncbi:MAG: hypothetical protein KGQ58_08275 [Proteobacteria bacterium]|nr:hypothetical protein [Pseudomonadota bacterium]
MVIRAQLIAAASLFLLLSACVTINIYFPAAAAKKAADRIIDDVWQLKPHQKTQAVPGTPQNPATK